MTIKDWVHNERFVELWNEGHRFFDVRRWAEGAKYFGANKREGLNAEVQSPTFEEFNKRTTVDAPYVWGKPHVPESGILQRSIQKSANGTSTRILIIFYSFITI